jgi:predicted phage terminase large subunit-like protein
MKLLSAAAGAHWRREEEIQQLVASLDEAPGNAAVEAPLHPAVFGRYFLRHHFRREFCRMHHASFARYESLVGTGIDALDRAGTRMALAAPRGSAKSTVHTLLLPLMDVCYAREKYIVILSATQVQASMRLRNLRNELFGNRRLHAAFGDAIKPQRPWSRTSLCVNGVRIDAYGALAEIRGISHGEARPTKIILDDAESSRRTLTHSGRIAMMQWYNEIVENLGDTYTHIEVVGTILHRESLLSELLKRTGFDGELYQSVVRWSEATEQWQTWRAMLLDRSDENREHNAQQYLQENREQMLRDTEVLWPAREDYVALMKQEATIGRQAFFKEKQNQPLSSEELVFHPAEWAWFQVMPTDELVPVRDRNDRVKPGDIEDKRVAQNENEEADDEHAHGHAFVNWRTDLVFYGYLDPALGRNFNAGDDAAIVTIGKARNGNLYVMDVWMERCQPGEQVARALQLHQKYRYSTFWVESVGIDETHYKNMARDRARKAGLQAHGLAQLPLAFDVPRIGKMERIQSICHYVENRQVWFNTAVPEKFVRQAEEHPTVHDDGLDALAGVLGRLLNHDRGAGQQSRAFTSSDARAAQGF